MLILIDGDSIGNNGHHMFVAEQEASITYLVKSARVCLADDPIALLDVCDAVGCAQHVPQIGLFTIMTSVGKDDRAARLAVYGVDVNLLAKEADCFHLVNVTSMFHTVTAFLRLRSQPVSLQPDTQ